MVMLQNAYAANARVISAVQQMFDALLGAVR
jgi:flagellar hook-associated protein FlgK